MKKTYISPEMEVVILDTPQHLLAGSTPGYGGAGGGAADSRFFEEDLDLLQE